MTTYARIASELSSALYATMTDQNTSRVCIDQDHTRAETVKAMVFQASEDDLGWDFSYEAVRDALQFIADTECDPEDPDFAHEFADGHVDSYNAARVSWLAESPISHGTICQEAADEIGQPTTDIYELIGWGQYEAYRRAFGAVAANWPADTGDEEDDEE